MGLFKSKRELPTLPSVAALVAGLTLDEQHPPYVTAKTGSAEAERLCTRRRAELAALEKRVGELASQISRGEASTSVLVESMRQRDACALVLAQDEAALAKAQSRVATEQLAAKAAVDRERAKRAEVLFAAAAEVSPFLRDLLVCTGALAKTIGIDGAMYPISWPDSPRAMMDVRAQALRSETPTGLTTREEI